MTMPNRLLVGTALCLLMAAPAGARAKAGDRAEPLPPAIEFPLILAQAEDPGSEGAAPGGEAGGGASGEDCPPGSASQAGGCVALEEAPAQEAPPEEVAPEAEAPAPEAVAPEPEAMPEPAPAEEAAPEQPAEPAIEPEAQAPAPAEEPAEAMPVEPEDEPAAEEPVEPQTEEQPPAEEPAVEDQPEEEAQPSAPAEEAQPEAEGEAQQPGAEEAPADDAGEEQPAQTEEEPAVPDAETQTQEEGTPAAECPPGMNMSATAGGCIPIEEEAMPADETPTEGQAQPDADTGEAPAEQAEPADEVAPDAEQQAEPSEAGEAPLEDTDTPEGAAEQAEEPAQEAMPENAAPVLDSQKEQGAQMPGEADPEAAPEAAEEQPAEGEQPEGQTGEAVVPESDEQAQENVVDPEQMREEIRSLVQEEGQRIELGQTPEDRLVGRREIFRQREGARVVEQYDDNRTIVEINNRVFVENPDYDRIVYRGDQVYYEELRGDRVREIVEREDGTRIITVRNRYGDILRRVRVMPDGGEYVLAYVPDDRFDVVTRFEDPAADLPPLRLTIPVSQYILEAETVDDPERYYTFLDQPPVEPVQRIYSLEEVQYSARVRDMVRRVDLDTIEFEFGSDRIEESQIGELEALATAMLRLLEENPAETFLIEGHTDAVGSETANLALSDQRAEAVARALTNVFGVPPENLVTQGYGEQYLKIGTEEPVRENRRVAVRRITPLVSPVANRQ